MPSAKKYLEDEMIICLDFYLDHKYDNPGPKKCSSSCLNPCTKDNHQINLEISRICTAIREKNGIHRDLIFRPPGSTDAKFQNFVSVDSYNPKKGLDRGKADGSGNIRELEVHEKYHGIPWDFRKTQKRKIEVKRILDGISNKTFNQINYGYKFKKIESSIPYNHSDPKEISKETGEITHRNQPEKLLEKSYKTFLESKGIVIDTRKEFDTPTTTLYGDLFLKKSNFMIEVKIYSRPNLRMVIGQIKDYALYCENYPKTAALFDKNPPLELIRLLESEDIFCIWRNPDSSFSGNIKPDILY